MDIHFYIPDCRVVLGISDSHQDETEESLVALKITPSLGWVSELYVSCLLLWDTWDRTTTSNSLDFFPLCCIRESHEVTFPCRPYSFHTSPTVQPSVAAASFKLAAMAARGKKWRVTPSHCSATTGGFLHISVCNDHHMSKKEILMVFFTITFCPWLNERHMFSRVTLVFHMICAAGATAVSLVLSEMLWNHLLHCWNFGSSVQGGYNCVNILKWAQPKP